jgi:hypothetical protein
MAKCILNNAGKGKGMLHGKPTLNLTAQNGSEFCITSFWGQWVTRHAVHHHAMSTAQYAMPGQTCNHAVWNKMHFSHLSRQTLTSGVMTDYDATAAFDRILSRLAIITCKWMGLPPHSWMFHVLPTQAHEIPLTSLFPPFLMAIILPRLNKGFCRGVAWWLLSILWVL